jgi:FAD/FMN-containing dehydrogenase
VVLPDGRVTMLGGLEPEPRATTAWRSSAARALGVATKIAVRPTPIPPVVRTLLLDFESVDAGARP